MNPSAWNCDANTRNIAWTQLCDQERKSTVLNDDWAQGNELSVRRIVSGPIMPRDRRFLPKSLAKEVADQDRLAAMLPEDSDAGDAGATAAPLAASVARSTTSAAATLPPLGTSPSPGRASPYALALLRGRQRPAFMTTSSDYGWTPVKTGYPRDPREYKGLSTTDVTKVAQLSPSAGRGTGGGKGKK